MDHNSAEILSPGNTGFAILFGNPLHLHDHENQRVFVGCLRSLLDPDFGAWGGTVMVLTDHPRFIERLLTENTSYLGGLSARIRIHEVDAEVGHAMRFKVAKCRLLDVLERENRARRRDNLPPLDYLVYLDQDIWVWNQVAPLLEEISVLQREKPEFVCYRQPGLAGEALHGGVFALHRTRSARWLRDWEKEMRSCDRMGIGRDQVAMTNMVRRDPGRRIQFLRFDPNYPVDFPASGEWRAGILLHFMAHRRNQADLDQPAFRECWSRLGLDEVRVFPLPGVRWLRLCHESVVLLKKVKRRILRGIQPSRW